MSDNGNIIDHKNSIAVLIGVSEYKTDTDDFWDLPNCINNVKKLQELLQNPKICNFQPENVHLFKGKVESAETVPLFELAKERSKQDLFLIYFTGHGTLESDTLELYLAFSNTRKVALQTTAIRIDDIISILKKSQAGRKILILDCCFSGAIKERYMGEKDVLIKSKLNTEGTFIMAASSAREPAKASPSEEYSLFSKYLIKSLDEGIQEKRDKRILTVGDIFEYVEQKVCLVSESQKPYSLNEKHGAKINFAINQIEPYTLKEAIKEIGIFKRNIKEKDEEIRILQGRLKDANEKIEKLKNYKKYFRAICQGIVALLLVIGLIFGIAMFMGQIPGKDMVKIKGGECLIGMEPDTPLLKLLRGTKVSDEEFALLLKSDIREVDFNQGFYIDQYEVSNKKYRDFLNFIKENGHIVCPKDELKGIDHVPSLWKIDMDQLKEESRQKILRMLDDNYPVVGITYYDAAAYAAWAGKSLPTADQWERVARGDTGSLTLYPWGDEFDPQQCNSLERKDIDLPLPVNDSGIGVNEKNIYGIIGNVSEWIRSDSNMVGMKGGNWQTKGELFGLLFSQSLSSREDGFDNVGFRCVIEDENGLRRPIEDMVYFPPKKVKLGYEISSKLLKLAKKHDISANTVKKILSEIPEGRPQELTTFWIDKYEVTNRQYQRFLDWVTKYGHSRCYSGEPPNKDHRPKSWDAPESNKQNYPVVGIDWYDAMSYASWAGKRLPTVKEWEAVSGGKKGRLYPWGDDFVQGHCNDKDYKEVDRTIEVTSMPEGVPPEGIFHLVGNVDEWVADGPSAVKRYIKGGEWSKSCLITGLSFVRFTVGGPEVRDRGTGFRCAVDPPPPFFQKWWGPSRK